MKTWTGRTNIFLALLFLTAANPASAFELLTQDVYSTGGYLQLRYTYYLNAAGEKVKHGTSTQWYTPPAYLVREVAQIQRYSHGKLHGLDEAWYPSHYTYGRVKHWEKEYQNGLLHGISRDWYQETGQPKSYAVYRYGKLHGAYKTFHYYRGDQLIDATYQDGLLHGHFKKWVVQNYSSGGYNYGLMQFQYEEGDYMYGKMHGYWKRWWTTASYPWYVKEEGNYGNDVKCGTWKYYRSTNGSLQSTVNEGPCQDVLPPGIGDPLPPGNKYEIRGQVKDKQTNAPISGALVQASGADTISNNDGFYSLVLDNGGTYSLNCVKDGYHDFTQQVDLSTAQYVNMGILLKQKEPGGKPAVVSVDSTGGSFFIEGFTANNEYAVAVDWNGDAPGTVKFEVNGTEYETNADQGGGRYTFDMGSAFTGSLSPAGNTLKITAVNDSGLASEPETLHPIVIPLPSWSVKMGDFEIKQDGKHLVYKLDTSWPEEPIEILVDEKYLGSVLWTAWGFVPYIGGRVFGIPGTQSFLTIEAKTDGSGSIAAGGKSGFNAAGGEIEIKLGGKGNLQYEPNRGLEWRETSLILGLSGTIERSVGPVTLIPALEGAVSLPVIGGAIGWFNERAEIKGSISSGSEMALEIMSATGEIGFNRADVETSSGIGLGLGIDIIENLSAEVSGGGTAKVFWQVPAAPDYFKKLETELTANITFSFLGFEWTTGYTHPFTYPETEPLAVRIPLSTPVLRPVSRDFLKKEPYNVQAFPGYRLPMGVGGAGPRSDHKIIENVFPYSQPAIALDNGNAAIVYVYLDPNDPVHQDTEIYYTLFDGTAYTTPAPILNDTRAEFAPTVAFDGSGKIGLEGAIYALQHAAELR